MVAFFSVFYLCRLLDVLPNAYDFIAIDTFADYVTSTRCVCVCVLAVLWWLDFMSWIGPVYGCCVGVNCKTKRKSKRSKMKLKQIDVTVRQNFHLQTLLESVYFLEAQGFCWFFSENEKCKQVFQLRHIHFSSLFFSTLLP